MPFGLEVADVTGVRCLHFFAFKRARLVRRQEIAHFVAGFEVLVGLAVARLNALADDQAAFLLAGVEYTALRHIEHDVARFQVQRAALRPGLCEHAAHPLIEINQDAVPVLPHDGKARQQPPRGQFVGDYQPPRGFIHIHPIGEQLEADDLARQARAGGRPGLRNQRSREQVVFAKTGFGNREQEALCHLQRRPGGRKWVFNAASLLRSTWRCSK